MKNIFYIAIALLGIILFGCGINKDAEAKANKRIADSVNKVAEDLSKSLELALTTNEIILDTTVNGNTHILIKKYGESVDTAASGIQGRVNLSDGKYSIKDINVVLHTKPIYEKKRKEGLYTINLKEDGTISEFWTEGNSIYSFDLNIGKDTSVKFSRVLYYARYELIIDIK
ncbi:MAG: hypothetical protein V4677_15715 [Bacteroidota bacterium]